MYRRLLNGVTLNDDKQYWVILNYADPQDKLIRITSTQYRTLMGSNAPGSDLRISQQLLIDLGLVNKIPFPNGYMVYCANYYVGFMQHWWYLDPDNPNYANLDIKEGDPVIVFEGVAYA